MADDDADDYMSMSFEDPSTIKESSLQKAQRLKKESRARGTIKSKAELIEEEAAAREKALSTSILDDASKNKGFAMMSKMGFTGGGLGKKDEEGKSSGRVEPINLEFKENRGGIGMDSEKKKRLREDAEERGIDVSKVAKLDPDDYRERMRKEREDAKLEKQFYAAQRMAERMDEEKGAQSLSSQPLKSISVLYRGLLKYREEQERERRMRHDLEQSLSRLPTYDDDSQDEDDKQALGKRQDYAFCDDLDEEDNELNDFNALDVTERLDQLLKYLRREHYYCFWCKMLYENENMEGCPGISEEDHD